MAWLTLVLAWLTTSDSECLFGCLKKFILSPLLTRRPQDMVGRTKLPGLSFPICVGRSQIKWLQCLDNVLGFWGHCYRATTLAHSGWLTYHRNLPMVLSLAFNQLLQSPSLMLQCELGDHATGSMPSLQHVPKQVKVSYWHFYDSWWTSLHRHCIFSVDHLVYGSQNRCFILLPKWLSTSHNISG